ncbi:unnamed protein product [Paramecium primaurelia]|uniref:RING-type domain-containing protein n=1 Tax=Paramecium primaurelia TaxID=5886 RepID=A0A8S1KL70_PARPR|nr:unnamed protein product [Paramecium primaurelia]
MKFILSCSICLQNLKNPVSLSCGHTFCQTCIQNSFETQEFCACPLCRQPALLSNNKTDELLPIVQQIYEQEGTQSLLNEFPSLIICLCCGLTPVNPVVLSCQHMFCQKCIEESLKEELLCPACSDYCFNIKVNTNKKYKDLIDWYLKEFKIEEEQEINQGVQNDNIYGIPIFFYDQSVFIYGSTEFQFLEFRYQEMIKMVSSGSGNFIVSSDMINGDLVQIRSIKKTKKGYQVQVDGLQRMKIKQIYAYIDGVKTQYQQQNNSQLWLAQCEYVKDQIFKENCFQHYNYIVATLQKLYQNINLEVRDIFQNFMKKITTLSNSESSLILLTSLNNNFEQQYYETDIEKRVQQIQQHFAILEQKIKGIYGKDDQIQHAKLKQDNIEIIQYPEFDVTTQYFLNLFNIKKVLCF